MPILLSMRRGALLCFLLLPVGLALAGVPAASEPGQRLPENARSALAQAWEQHPSAEVARRELEAAQARARSASRPIYNPELEFGAERADVDTIEAGASLTLDIGGKGRA